MHSAADPTTAAELEAIGRLAEVLEDLDPGLQRRAIRWAADRYGIRLGGSGASSWSSPLAIEVDPSAYATAGQLVAAAAPSTQLDRALIVAYWLQESRGETSATFSSLEVNRELKLLGHRSDDITRLMATLVSTDPQRVVLVEKTGTYAQARKRFALTEAGRDRVRELLTVSSNEDAVRGAIRSRLARVYGYELADEVVTMYEELSEGYPRGEPRRSP